MILVGLLTAVQGLDQGTDDTERFPVCMTDKDCEDFSDRVGTEYKCFQYRCFPWKDPVMQGSFRSCARPEDCSQLEVEEGGDGSDGKCFRHQDRGHISTGICLKESSLENCHKHSDCKDDLKCVNGNCGEESYFQALNTFHCVDHDYCQDLLLGNLCCYDFTSEDTNHTGKTCCDGEGSVGVIMPEEIHDDTLAKIDTKVGDLEKEEKENVCATFPEEILSEMSNCEHKFTDEPTPDVEVITTTTTTVVQTTTTDTTTTVTVEEASESEEATLEDVNIAEVIVNNAAVAVGSLQITLVVCPMIVAFVFGLH